MHCSVKQCAVVSMLTESVPSLSRAYTHPRKWLALAIIVPIRPSSCMTTEHELVKVGMMTRVGERRAKLPERKSFLYQHHCCEHIA